MRLGFETTERGPIETGVIDSFVNMIRFPERSEHGTE